MGLQDIINDENPATKKMVDAFAWMLNIFTSVAIVMVNKQLMGGSADRGLTSGCPRRNKCK